VLCLTAASPVLGDPESTRTCHQALSDEGPPWIGCQPLDFAIFRPLGVLAGIGQSEVQPSESLERWSSPRSNEQEYARCHT